MGRVRSLRRLLSRLERDAGSIVIPQRDGTVARFSEKDAGDAFARNLSILRAKAAGVEPPPIHPMQRAVKNAAAPESWHVSYCDEFKVLRRDGSVVELGEVEDLSEP